MLNTLIEFGTNYGSTIEALLVATFVGIIITTVIVATKESKNV